MGSAEHLIGVAEAAGPDLENARKIARQADYVPNVGGRFAVARARATLVHYGSPFELRLLLEGLTVPGLAALFYGAKRIFAVDFEFKAYPEKRRAEFLEAKALAEELQAEWEEREEKASGWSSRSMADQVWKAEKASIRDEP